MDVTLAAINWWAVLAAIVAGQVISTVWFVVLFGEPWAKEYGAFDKKQHTKEVPGYTYAVQILCTVILVMSLAILQQWLAVGSMADALKLGLLVAIGFCVATGVPGQAFLKRWRVAAIAFGCQATMIVAISLILAALG